MERTVSAKPPIADMKDYKAKLRTLEEYSREITARGNDMEVRRGRDTIKIYEVKKKLIGEIKR